MAIQGENDYNNRTSAREGAEVEIASLVTTGLPIVEFTPIATVIYQTSNGYGNTVMGRIRTTDEGADYIDWRGAGLSQSVFPADHGNLGGLQEDDHSNVYLRVFGRDGSLADKAALDAAYPAGVTYEFMEAVTGGFATATRGRKWICLQSDAGPFNWVEIVNGGL